MNPRRLLWILGMLPFLAWGGELGPTKAKTVVDQPRLLLRIYNGESGTLLVKTARIAVAEPGSSSDKPACATTVKVAQTVRRGVSKDMELLPLEEFAECASQGGYRIPVGARPLEASESPICKACVPEEDGGGAMVAIPFSVRLEMSCPGTLQEYWTFTNYLFFQTPPKGRPILLQ